ncbi:hypothetical protein HMPREF9104_03297 [Lentilactobacillus kisonensis F0435]|uniref:Uncharacterized protein n=1 Tax=Lentilactobacillus kisonensis F0435 TaxID=797516 RepID=H1LKZ1_9LACO|nr:hypothetical protein HMPREF9104_03297 [Lentilactobacillus kisonensis F0435]
MTCFKKLGGSCEPGASQGELIVEWIAEQSKSSRFIAVIDFECSVIEKIGGNAINRPMRIPVWFLVGLFSFQIEKF